MSQSHTLVWIHPICSSDFPKTYKTEPSLTRLSLSLSLWLRATSDWPTVQALVCTTKCVTFSLHVVVYLSFYIAYHFILRNFHRIFCLFFVLLHLRLHYFYYLFECLHCGIHLIKRARKKKFVESLSVVGFRVIHTAGDSWFHLLHLDPLFPFFFLMGSIIIFLSSCGVVINYVFLGCGVFQKFVVDDSVFFFLFFSWVSWK